MEGRILLAIGLVAAIGCSDSTRSDPTGNEKTSTGGLSASGTVYGFIAAPDSQRVAIAGAEIHLVYLGDFAPPPPPDTTFPPPGDTTFMVRHAPKATLDTVFPPEAPPVQPPSCGLGTEVATAVTDAEGNWTATGLGEGLYSVVVSPSDGKWSATEYCGFAVTTGSENQITLYLVPGPGPDPVP